MYRTHTCGELQITDIDKEVTLSGWVAIRRDLGGMTFIDLRDRYGITQLVFSEEEDLILTEKARKLGREYVIQIEGVVSERSNKNPDRQTGDIEILVSQLIVLNQSALPPFTIEEETDGGEELRMKHRYLDLRRPNLQQNLIFRSKVAVETRKYLSKEGFVEVETPFLIKSTPEGARDFVVPSRMHPGQFYALPQSPQTFKQLLMISGLDKYFQIVKCFRDEDFRADRQPEFSQIDCEMSFVTQDEILDTFEGMTRYLFGEILDLNLPEFPRMTYDDALAKYGSDKPDLRFGMEFHDLKETVSGKGFNVFDKSEAVLGICANGVAEEYSNKDLKKLTDWVTRPQIGAKGLVYLKCNEDGSFKSPVNKFYSDDDFQDWMEVFNAEAGDLILVLSGDLKETRRQLGALRLEMGRRGNLMKDDEFKPLWVVDFPLLEWDHELQRFFAMHHPFTSPKSEDIDNLMSEDQKVLEGLRADAYDLVINGVEIGGGSIRIHNKKLQEKNFKALGFTDEEAKEQFGFLLDAFQYGAPPHGGIAFGFDRLVAVMAGKQSIREFMAFPKNNQGRDVMIDAPAKIDLEQLQALHLQITDNDKEE